MFGNFNRTPKPARPEAPRAPLTDPAAIEELQEKVQTVVDAHPTIQEVATAEDIKLVVDYLAQAQEKTGTAYTVENLNDFSEGLPEEIQQALADRLETRGIVLPESHNDEEGEQLAA